MTEKDFYAKYQNKFVTLITINGFQMKGRVLDVDDKAIFLLEENKEQLIYKHAISTIRPL